MFLKPITLNHDTILHIPWFVVFLLPYYPYNDHLTMTAGFCASEIIIIIEIIMLLAIF